MNTEEEKEILISRIINLLEDVSNHEKKIILKELLWYYSIRLKNPQTEKTKTQIQSQITFFIENQ